jgi:hypothetical protein
MLLPHHAYTGMHTHIHTHAHAHTHLYLQLVVIRPPEASTGREKGEAAADVVESAVLNLAKADLEGKDVGQQNTLFLVTAVRFI